MVCLAKKKRKGLKIRTNNKTSNNNKLKGFKVYKANASHKKKQVRARRAKNIQTFLVVLIIILAVAAVFSAAKTFFPDLFGKISLGGELAARVNGKPITMQQLNTEYERLPLQYKYIITKEAFLTQLIDESLMIEQALRQGLSVTEQEVDESLETFMQSNNLTKEGLDELLKQKELSLPDLRSLIKNQLLIDRLIKQVVKSKVNVTTAQALQYYNDNPDTFKVPELVTARHILIGLDNRTEQQAEERANMVLDLVKNVTGRFCSYVWLYTDDSESAEKCGEYTFPRGQMTEEFENTAFEQDVGEISLVKTSFGYHIIQTINKTPEQLIPFKDMQEQIIVILETQQEKMLYSDFIVGLREEADIVNYLEKEKEAVEEVIVPEEEAVEEDIEEEAVEEEVAEEEIEIVIEEPEEVEEVEVVEEPEEVIEEIAEEEVEEVVEEVVEEEIEVVEEMPVLSFAECLTSQGAVLYGAYWDSSTKKQKAYFGAEIVNINYIECGVEGDYRAQQEVCEEEGILAYPTWIIDDEKHMGIMTPKQLAALTGCEV